MSKPSHLTVELPLVSVIGRPNVGKSSLVNRITSGQEAIIEETSGVTRDRNFIRTDWSGREFFLVDTGGIDLTTRKELDVGVTEQSRVAATESDVIIHLVDGRAGISSEDREIADMLRKLKVPVILAVNKIDSPKQEPMVYEFFELSEGEPHEVSAIQGLGIGELLDEVVALLPEAPAISEEEKGIPVAIIGKPNVGKSQLLNRILGVERVVVSDIPGTTRDAIHTRVERDGKEYLFIDTAGLRRRGAEGEALEYYSMVRTVRAMEVAEVAVLMVDAVDGLTDQDQRIAKMAADRGCCVVVVFNKWDLIEDGEYRSDFLRDEVDHRMQYLNDPYSVTASALTGKRVEDIFKAIDATHEDYTRHVSTPMLNKFVSENIRHQPPVSRKGTKFRIYYVSQMEKPPPAFVFSVNDPSLADDSYRRYLENQLRDAFGFRGCPINLHFRRRR